MLFKEEYLLTERSQLREVVGEPGPRVARKTISHIDELCASFIRSSPYALIATLGRDGLLDISPKGDPCGFVDVADEKTLIVPERLGNGRFDTYENLFVNPIVGMIFLIPGRGDTLRVAGDAQITRDPDILARYPVHGKLPRFALAVTVREAFLHCSKSSVRSGLWQPENWPNTSGVPTLAEAMVSHGNLDLLVEDMQGIIDRDGKERLY